MAAADPTLDPSESPRADGQRADVPAIATRLTAREPAAVATIAIQGAKAVAITSSLARLRTDELEIDRIYFGSWPVPIEEAESEEQVVVCRTAHDGVEIHCHGGEAVCQVILRTLADQGVRLIDAKQWPGKATCPLAQAAEQDLLLATTDRTAAILLDQFAGALGRAIRQVLRHLQTDHKVQAKFELQRLLQWAELGMHLTAPWRVVLAGPPNVGKSSLINALAGQSASIVHHEPGTTRDWVEAYTAIDGWPVALTDTAGVRDSQNAIENEGVRRAYQCAASADLLLLVVDATVGWTAEHAQLTQLHPRFLVVWNKCDLISPSTVGDGAPGSSHRCVSAVERAGIDELWKAVSATLVPQMPPPHEPVAFRQHQVAAIQQAVDYLEEDHGQDAATPLESLLLG